MYTHVCKTANRVKKQVADYVKKIDWKKVAITAGAIGVGIVLTVATGGLGAPVAMAIGGAASGAIISGYDAYSSGQRGWALAGSTLKGAGLGAITGFVGGQFIGAGANVAANVTQNIANQTVRQVVSAGVEAGVETAIDTGISLATGNPISLKNVVTDYGLNIITNGSGSVSSKKSAKADVNTSKPKPGDVPVTKSRQESTPVQQLSKPGPTKKFTSGTDFDNFNSSYKDRLNQTPKNGGTWTGTRGESKFISSDDNVNGILLKYNQDGITYKNAVPDFSSVTEHQVEIPNMTTNRAKNFGAADSQLAADLGVTKADIRNYRKDNVLTWHELNDMTTMQLVPTDVNAKFGHLGGVSEVRLGMMVKP